jgi:hypothetical protein
MLTSFIIASLIPCGYLVARGAAVFVTRYTPLVVLSAQSIILGWPCSFIVVSILSIYESFCYLHQFWHCSGSDSSQFFNKVWMAKAKCKGIYCSLIRDVFLLNFLLYSPVVCMNATSC